MTGKEKDGNGNVFEELAADPCEKTELEKKFGTKGSETNANFENFKTTLCWRCDKVDCSWMDDFTPVEGWVATRYDYKTDMGVTDSYLVKYCPEFEKDTR